MRNRDQKKAPSWISIAVVLLLAAPEITIPIAICGGIGYLVYYLVKNRTVPIKTNRRPKQAAFDDCPKKLFCFHEDKGEHHVRKGREIDPWDRPDIDISKYQRKG